MTAQEKFSSLVKLIYECDDVAVAFSGGTNSSLLLCAAQEAHGKNVWALTANAAFSTQEELYRVHEVLEDYKLNDARIPVYVLQEKSVAKNGADRCETCRKLLSEGVAKAAKNLGASVLLDGRIGEQAGCVDGRMANVEIEQRSPLAELGFVKSDISEMLCAVGRNYYIREPVCCLAERFASGEHLTPEKLDFVEKAEKEIRKFAGKDCSAYFSDWNIAVYTARDLLDCEKENITQKLKEDGAKNVSFTLLEE